MTAIAVCLCALAVSAVLALVFKLKPDSLFARWGVAPAAQRLALGLSVFASSACVGILVLNPVGDLCAVALWAGVMERTYVPELLKGLQQDQGAITMSEYDTVAAMAEQPGVSSLAYFNAFGEVRWSTCPDCLMMNFDQYEERAGRLLTDSVAQAFKTGRSAVNLARRGVFPAFEVALPLPCQKRTAVLEFKTTSLGMLRLLTRGRRIVKKSSYAAGAYLPRTPHIHNEARQRFLGGLAAYQKGDRARAAAQWRAAQSIHPGYPNIALWLERARP